MADNIGEDNTENETKLEAANEPMETNMENDSDDDDSSSSDSSSEDEKADEEKELQISTLGKQISQNPYAYDNHPARIKILRELHDLQRLREAREEMSKYFPLTEELWLDWLKDEIPLVASDADRKRIEELFEKAFQDYQSVPVWLEYVQFSIGRMEETDGIKHIRDAFERALTAVGLHPSQGANIWEAYREFENALLMGLMPQPGTEVMKDQEEAFSIQNQRVATLFKRQMAVPLQHMDMTVREYCDWLGEDKIDPTTQTQHNKAKTIFEGIQPLEDRLMTTAAPHLEVYQDYIKHEMKSDDPSRITCIFERALKENCLVPQLWLQYTQYMEKLKMKEQTVLTYKRALRNCPWVSQLWVNFLLVQERQESSFNSMKELVDKALAVGFQSPADYLNVWTHYCDYLRRRIVWDEDHEEQLETFRMTIERAVDFMFESYGAEGDPEETLSQFWAIIEAKFCKNQEKAREIWNQIMQAGHGAEAEMWLQYYHLERMFGDNKHCRRILQKALNSVTDWPESITKAYINFEREEGSLEQFDAAYTKCQAQLERVNDRRAKAAEKEAVLQDLKKKDQKARKQTQKSDQSSGGKSDIPHDDGGEKTAVGNKNKRKFDSSEADVFVKPYLPKPKTEEPARKKVKEDDKLTEDSEAHQAEAVKHDPSKDNITIFVSNLDFSIELDRLRQVFQKCGEITDVRLVTNYKGKSKGFGYVEFKDSNAVLQALRMDRELIDGRPVFVSRCEDRSSGKATHQFKFATNLEKNKLFIKGLPFTITKEALETIFKEHGKIKDVRMVTYRNGRPKGIAYVEYENESTASQAVLKTDGLQIGEHIISVAISNPPERKTQLSARLDPPPRMTSLGGGKKESNFRGKAHTQVSLVPRAIRNLASSSSSSSSSSSAPKPSSSGDANPPQTKSGTDGDSKPKSSMSNADFRSMLLK